MQLTIRGQNTHLLECTGSESIAELKVKYTKKMIIL